MIERGRYDCIVVNLPEKRNEGYDIEKECGSCLLAVKGTRSECECAPPPVTQSQSRVSMCYCAPTDVVEDVEIVD